jgi:hypothetical protein
MLSNAFCVALPAATAVALALAEGARTEPIRAPRKPGLFTLYVTAAAHPASSPVVVPRRGAP